MPLIHQLIHRITHPFIHHQHVSVTIKMHNLFTMAVSKLFKKVCKKFKEGPTCDQDDQLPRAQCSVCSSSPISELDPRFTSARRTQADESFPFGPRLLNGNPFDMPMPPSASIAAAHVEISEVPWPSYDDCLGEPLYKVRWERYSTRCNPREQIANRVGACRTPTVRHTPSAYSLSASFVDESILLLETPAISGPELPGAVVNSPGLSPTIVPAQAAENSSSSKPRRDSKLSTRDSKSAGCQLRRRGAIRGRHGCSRWNAGSGAPACPLRRSSVLIYRTCILTECSGEDCDRLGGPLGYRALEARAMSIQRKIDAEAAAEEVQRRLDEARRQLNGVQSRSVSDVAMRGEDSDIDSTDNLPASSLKVKKKSKFRLVRFGL